MLKIFLSSIPFQTQPLKKFLKPNKPHPNLYHYNYNLKFTFPNHPLTSFIINSL